MKKKKQTNWYVGFIHRDSDLGVWGVAMDNKIKKKSLLGIQMCSQNWDQLPKFI